MRVGKDERPGEPFAGNWNRRLRRRGSDAFVANLFWPEVSGATPVFCPFTRRRKS